MLPNKFTVRVYGILVNDRSQVLVADEFIAGKLVTKFPGGGLEFGEGTIQCLQREFREETGQEINLIKHLYTTDFYIRSKVNPEFQVIAVYYSVSCDKTDLITVDKTNEGIVLRWLPVFELNENTMTLESDKAALKLLIE